MGGGAIFIKETNEKVYLENNKEEYGKFLDEYFDRVLDEDKKLKRAGLDYWHLLDITYYSSTEDFFERNPGEAFYYFSTKAPKKYTDVTYPEKCFIVFGKETAGLPEELLYNNPETTVRIPMISDARSLNLSNSVAIGVYEILRQWNFPQLQSYGALRNYNW